MSGMIETIDLKYLGLPGAIASYLLRGPDGYALVEAGPGSTFEELKKGLAARGVGLDDIRDVLVTHIHLDHAGAAGMLARHGARVWVHEEGAKHLIDPTKLIDSATRIYGNQMDRLWGKIIPIPASQVMPVKNGDVIDVAGMRLTALQTPGHAKHHHAFVMEDDGERIAFVGDAAGIVLPREAWTGTENHNGKWSRFLIVPTPPPEFDREAWKQSLAKLRETELYAIYLTHYGRCNDVNSLLSEVEAQIEEQTARIGSEIKRDAKREEILEGTRRMERERAREAGLSEWAISQYVSNNLLTMNVDGILRYWMKKIPELRPQNTESCGS
ncbi:MAG TPA: MBL fold metallo-hydrolase [Phycisphaerales bacterium]|nr:MBL fold metallo-hydrolase [Phycisphaerales bacterium]